MSQPDAIVIGAGPVGCVTALALARRAARVLLLESRWEHPRLSGEWLLPPAVRVLQTLGLDGTVPAGGNPALAALPGSGCVISFSPDLEPCLLPYPPDSLGLAWEHQALVKSLRLAAENCANITLREGRVSTIEGQTLTCCGGYSTSQEKLRAELIVGADGRSSVARRSLGLPENHQLLSYMAGAALEGAVLPHEGWGHLILGAPGPMVLFRLSPGQVRLAATVPLQRIAELKQPQRLFACYASWLPEGCRDAFRRATESDQILWAPCQCRPRTSYGRPGLALVGDAVGLTHPLTASGMSLGFLDALALSESNSIQEYRRTRSRPAKVGERMARFMYELCTVQSPGTWAMCAAVFRLWRDSERERAQGIRLICGEDLRFAELGLTAFRLLAQSCRELLSPGRGASWRTIPAGLIDLLARIPRLL